MSEFGSDLPGDARRCDNIRVFSDGGSVHLNFEVQRFAPFGTGAAASMRRETTASLVLSPDIARKLADAINRTLTELPLR